jgi:multiple sugar transport system permease protein
MAYEEDDGLSRGEKVLTKRSAAMVLPTYIFLISWGLLSFVPVIWMFITAFLPKEALQKMPPDINLTLMTFDNFKQLLAFPGKEFSLSKVTWYGQDTGVIIWWFLNSFFLASVNTCFNLFFDSLAGYAFAKRDFPGRNFLFWTLICTMMVPGQVVLVPLFLMMINLGLYDSFLAIILPSIAGVFGIFLMKQYIQSMPTGLEEAARIDGCSEFGIFIKIILPLCKPVLAVLGIFVFVGNWNNFLWPMIVLKSQNHYTLQVGLSILQQLQEHEVHYGIQMAGAVVAAAPILCVFLFLQKYFIKGLTIGGVKG